MARRSRQNIDYFPMDVYFDQDEKLRLLEIEFGNKSTTVYIKLIARIYREKGWWKKWTDDIEMLFASDINESHSYVHEVIQGCLKRGLFDKSVFEMFGVLTSASIQERYIEIVNQLGRKSVVIVLEYWVCDNDFVSYSRISPDLINISSDEKTDNTGRNATNRKEKEREKEREIERRAREKKSDEPISIDPPKTVNDVIEIGNMKTVPPEACEVYYNMRSTDNFMRTDKHGNWKPILNWHADLYNCYRKGYLKTEQSNNNNHGKRESRADRHIRLGRAVVESLPDGDDTDD